MTKKLRLNIIFFTFLFFSQNVFSLKSDKDQPIDITADRLEINDVTHISTYTGNVLLVQGSLKVKADSLILYFDDENVLDYMEMFGKPAHLTQLDNDNKPMTGIAEIIEYRDIESILILKENAELESEGDLIKSDYIKINTESDIVNAGKEDKKDRVSITILPREDKK